MNRYELALWQIRAICKSIDSELLAGDLVRKAISAIIKLCEQHCRPENEVRYKKCLDGKTAVKRYRQIKI